MMQRAIADSPARRSWWVVLRWCLAGACVGVLLAMYISQARVYLPAYEFQINPDGVGYMSVAQHYLHGHWWDAVNAYWSPLYSWLMVPLLWCGFPALLTTKLVSLAAGGLALCSAWRLGHHMNVRLELRLAACLAMVPFVVYFALWVITPDLLVAAMVLTYLASSCSRGLPTAGRTPESPATETLRGALVGLLAGLCYLAKAYALPVVAAHYLLMSIVGIATARGRRWRATGQAAIGLFVFAAIVAGWSGTLTAKFGYFMTGSTGRYNYALNGPTNPGQIMNRGRLIPPPNPSAVTMWEDPTYHIPPSWNPLNSQAEWDHQVKLLDRNLDQTTKILDDFLPWWPAALAAGLLMAIAAGRAQERRSALAVVAMALGYPLGYLLLHTERRFLMVEPLLMVLLGAQAISIVSAGRWWIRWPIQWAAMGIVLWWSTSYPVKSLVKPTVSVDKGVHAAAARLLGVVPAGSRVASIGDWSRDMYICFDLNLRHYGVTSTPVGNVGIIRQWREHGIEYVFSSSPVSHSMLKPVTPGRVGGLWIYRFELPSPATAHATTRP